MKNSVDFPTRSEAFPLLARASALACEGHANAPWKNPRRPHLFHAYAVASLVLRYGGDDAQAAAACVHDLLDAPQGKTLASTLSEEVDRLAHAFADPPAPEGEAKNDWGNTRRRYLEKLKGLDRRALLIVGCEELHEITELLEDLREEPAAEVWKRQSAPRHNLGWYFREILLVLRGTLDGPGSSPGERALITAFAARLRAFLPVAFEAGGSADL